LLGRIDPGGGRKGHRELIRCWPQVVRSVPGARLLIAGGGQGEPIVRALANGSPVREQIDLLGFVPEAEVEALWTRADVFAMPSRGEGLGLAYIEAMRHGLPVIGSVHDAAVEINLHGSTGYNVDLGEEGALAARLIELLRDRELAARMGAASQARWQASFRYEAFLERMRPILREFVGVS
jgi:phosphatidylinositol alpha-1,6-mannosyltransferase